MHAGLRAFSLKRHFFPLLAACLLHAPAHAVELVGEAVQGGLLFGTSRPGSQVLLDGVDIMVSADGRFVIGFDRDETGEPGLAVADLGGRARGDDATEEWQQGQDQKEVLLDHGLARTM